MSSFRKRHVQKPIPGTRTSPQTGQTITSSGNPSLDVILGGGLPVGSICLIEEDKYVTYSKVLAKYFLAEGVVSGQSIFLGSLDEDPNEIMGKLPKPLNDDEVELEKSMDQDNGQAPKNGLRIAWRYTDLPPVNSEQTPSKIGHQFNLMEHMDTSLQDFVDTVLWNGESHGTSNDSVAGDDEQMVGKENDYFDAKPEERSDDGTDQNTTSSSSGSNDSATDFKTEQDEVAANISVTTINNEIANNEQIGHIEVVNDAQQTFTSQSTNSVNSVSAHNQHVPQIFNNLKYQHLLKAVQSFAREDKFTVGTLVLRSLCRICITSLGSPLWYDEDLPKNMLKFLTVLRGVVRNSVSACFITMPMHLIAKCDATLVPKIRNLVDYAIELESFAGSERETNPAYKEYNGLLHLHKITAVNTLTAYMPETSDLAFKLRRKKFVIEKLHLPPELQEVDAESKPTFSCSGNTTSTAAAMDF